MTERQQQITAVEWWRLQHRKHAKCLFSIPNGTYLHGDKKARIRQMSALKAEGFKNGVSDLFLMIPRGSYHGLFIEMKDVGKTEKNLSDDQSEHIELAIEMGYMAVCAIGADHAIRILKKYMSLGEFIQ